MSMADERTALVEPSAAGLPAISGSGKGRGTELVERSDISLTRVQTDGKAGGFRWVGSDTVMPQITITPIFFYKTRVLFGDAKENEPVVLCRSSNSLYPSEWDGQALATYNLANPAADCESCLFNQWTKDPKTNKRKPPRCRLQFNFLVHITETNEIAVLSVHGSSITAAKQITSEASKSPRDFWARTYILGTRKAGQGMETFYMLEIVTSSDTTPPEALEVYAKVFEEIVGDNPRRAAETLAGGRGEASGQPEPTAALTPDAMPATDVEEGEVPF